MVTTGEAVPAGTTPPAPPETASSIFSHVAALGARVEEAWKAVHRDEKALPDIAFDALGRFDPPAFRLDDVSRFLLTTRTAQPTVDRVFSDMPVTVYRGDGFYVELLIWVDGTTAIHQHGFSGAFRVLHGSSLHSVYEFEEMRRINSRTRLGRVTCTGMRYLKPGDRHRIRSGPDGLAHALFHLERPSVTLVVRTDGDPDAGPQFTLHPPALALDPRFPYRLKEPLRRWVTVLDRLGAPLRMDDPLVDRFFDLDFGLFAGFALSYPDFAARLDGRTPWEQALGAPGAGRRRLAERFGAKEAAVLMHAILEQQRCGSLRRTRSDVTDPELRFFLALLLNGRSREQVFAAVRDRRAGDDPVRVCSEALLRLAELAGDPDRPDVSEHSPWLRTLHEIVKPLGADAPAVAHRVVTGRFPKDGRTPGAGAAEAVAKAASALAALPELHALSVEEPASASWR